MRTFAENYKARPIIFMAHSLGGILVKKGRGTRVGQSDIDD